MPPSGAGARARTLARTLALLALLVLSPRLASAEPSVPAGETAVHLVRNFWDLVASQQGEERTARPESRAIEPAPQGAAPVDLSDLSNPARIESRLKSALAPRDGAVRLTVSEGTAQAGRLPDRGRRDASRVTCSWCRATRTCTAACTATSSRWMAT